MARKGRKPLEDRSNFGKRQLNCNGKEKNQSKNGYKSHRINSDGDPESSKVVAYKTNDNGKSLNVNPAEDIFEKLLESPIKQPVSFQPLSFWAKKVENLECKKKKGPRRIGTDIYDYPSGEDSSPSDKKKIKKKKIARPRKKKVDPTYKFANLSDIDVQIKKGVLTLVKNVKVNPAKDTKKRFPLLYEASTPCAVKKVNFSGLQATSKTSKDSNFSDLNKMQSNIVPHNDQSKATSTPELMDLDSDLSLSIQIRETDLTQNCGETDSFSYKKSTLTSNNCKNVNDCNEFKKNSSTPISYITKRRKSGSFLAKLNFSIIPKELKAARGDERLDESNVRLNVSNVTSPSKDPTNVIAGKRDNEEITSPFEGFSIVNGNCTCEDNNDNNDVSSKLKLYHDRKIENYSNEMIRATSEEITSPFEGFSIVNGNNTCEVNNDNNFVSPKLKLYYGRRIENNSNEMMPDPSVLNNKAVCCNSSGNDLQLLSNGNNIETDIKELKKSPLREKNISLFNKTDVRITRNHLKKYSKIDEEIEETQSKYFDKTEKCRRTIQEEKQKNVNSPPKLLLNTDSPSLIYSSEEDISMKESDSLEFGNITSIKNQRERKRPLPKDKHLNNGETGFKMPSHPKKNRISVLTPASSMESVPFCNTVNHSNLNEMETTQLFFNPEVSHTGNATLYLKSGKHARARSVMRSIQNGRISLKRDSFKPEPLCRRGRLFETFVETILERQFEELENNTTLTRAQSRTKRSAMISSRKRYASCAPVLRKSLMPLATKTNSTLMSASICPLEMTVRVVPEKEHEPTPFREVFGIDQDNAGDITKTTWTARDEVLSRCRQTEPLPFAKYYNEETLPNCRKIGEGVYGEVFAYDSPTEGSVVFKIIPIEGDIMINDEPQKSFEEILSEVVITMELSNLRNGKEHCTSGFTELKRVRCVFGEFPPHLADLWLEFDEKKGSENEDPSKLPDDQMYIVLELSNGGRDLESFVFQNAEQTRSAFLQTAFSLAVAERSLQFEHRDLHWGNMLIDNTKDKFVKFCLDGKEYEIETNGVKVSIIDFTLSRMTFDGCSVYNDLAVDPGLFTSQGDYQFDIYRMMQNETKNNWDLFKPKTNVFWLHYTLDKMVAGARYAKARSKSHQNALRTLFSWKTSALKFIDSTSLVLSIA